MVKRDPASPGPKAELAGMFPLHDFIDRRLPMQLANSLTLDIWPEGRSDMVEPDGIEPTTSCLQSTRSPN